MIYCTSYVQRTVYRNVHNNKFAPFKKEREREISDKWRWWPLRGPAYPLHLMKWLPPGGTVESVQNNGYRHNNTSHPGSTYTHHYSRREVAFIEKKNGGWRYWSRQIHFSKIPWWLYMSTGKQNTMKRKERYDKGNLMDRGRDIADNETIQKRTGNNRKEWNETEIKWNRNIESTCHKSPSVCQFLFFSVSVTSLLLTAERAWQGNLTNLQGNQTCRFYR